MQSLDAMSACSCKYPQLARTKFVEISEVTVSEEQCNEFSHIVEATKSQVESGEFSFHSGIRFPQNRCVSCSIPAFASITSN